MATILVIRTTSGRTITHFRPDQEYGDPTALGVEVHGWVQADDPTVGAFSAAALCEDSLLTLSGTDLDQHVSIARGVVKNANSSV